MIINSWFCLRLSRDAPRVHCSEELCIAFITLLSDIKQGRGSGFPGKRRPRGAGLSGRGGRGRSKLKNGIGAVVIPGVRTLLSQVCRLL